MLLGSVSQGFRQGTAGTAWPCSTMAGISTRKPLTAGPKQPGLPGSSLTCLARGQDNWRAGFSWDCWPESTLGPLRGGSLRAFSLLT